MTLERAKDLVYMHNNLSLLSRNTPQYNEGEKGMWDLGGDGFESFEGPSILEVVDLSLDDPDLKVLLFVDGDEDEAIGVGSNWKKALTFFLYFGWFNVYLVDLCF